MTKQAVTNLNKELSELEVKESESVATPEAQVSTSPETKSPTQAKTNLLNYVFSMAIVLIVVPAILFFSSDNRSTTQSSSSALQAAKIDLSLQNKTSEQKCDLTLLERTLEIIRKKYIREVSVEELINGAIEGINYSLDKFGHRDMGLKLLTEKEVKELDNKQLIDLLSSRFAELLKKVEVLPQNQRLIKRSQLEKAIKARIAELEAKNSQSKSERGKSESLKSPQEITEAKDKTNSDSIEQDESSTSNLDLVTSDQICLDNNDSEIIKDADGKPVVLTDTYLLYSALNGMLTAINDPFSTALLPEDIKIFKEMLGASNYGGVGIYLEADWQNNRQLTVIEPIEGTPAALKDIRSGDKIMAIDGKKTSSLDIDTASAMIRGKIGSVVVLTMQRGGKTFEVALKRTSIHVPSVNGKMLQNQIGYLRVRFFGSQTSQEFDSALQQLLNDGAKSLIVDLRNNGGGYVDAAIDLSSEFLPRHKSITSVVNPRLSYCEPYLSNSQKGTKLPLILLVNRFSASASEITSGAMKDYNRAILIGETTYGKGSVQELYPLSDGGALKLTIAHYLTPKDKDIHLKGIDPHVKFESRPSNKIGSEDDLQLKLAVHEAEFMMKQKVGAVIDESYIEKAQQEAESWKSAPDIAKLIAQNKAEEEKLRATIKEEIKKQTKFTRDVR
ncbi:MAG: S41 family peptidase [Candidatus Bruticola sp.]